MKNEAFTAKGTVPFSPTTASRPTFGWRPCPRKSGQSLTIWLVAICVALAVAGCAGKAAIPTSYTTYSCSDGSFHLEYPTGWEAEGGDNPHDSWAKFTSGGAQIYVDASSVGSLMGDLAKPKTMHVGGDVVTPDEEQAPVAVVHEDERPGFEDDQGVTEQKPVVVKTGYPDARKSEFTGSKTFGGAIRGCRVTALGPNRRIRVVCQCPEAEWEALKPAFDKAIESVAHGKALK
jgi:hypothetical protein